MKTILIATACAILTTSTAFANEWKEAAGALQLCFIKSMAFGETPDGTISTCMLEGAAYCQATNLDKGSCMREVSGIFNQTQNIFQAEYDNYSRSLTFGAPYEPALFDFRVINR